LPIQEVEISRMAGANEEIFREMDRESIEKNLGLRFERIYHVLVENGVLASLRC
jgi:hypothetical protein